MKNYLFFDQATKGSAWRIHYNIPYYNYVIHYNYVVPRLSSPSAEPTCLSSGYAEGIGGHGGGQVDSLRSLEQYLFTF